MAEALLLGQSLPRAAFSKPLELKELAKRRRGAFRARVIAAAHSGERLHFGATHTGKTFSCPVAPSVAYQRQFAVCASSSDGPSGLSGAELAAWVNDTNQTASVVVYSKTYCP